MKPVYSVPSRFGLLAIFAFMTLQAILFGLLRKLDAHPSAYIYLSIQGFVICLVQMKSGSVPRLASIAAGSTCAVITLFGAMPMLPQNEAIGSILALPCIATSGGMLGYLHGTMAAGLFLLIEMFEERILPKQPVLPPIPAEQPFIVDSYPPVLAEQPFILDSSLDSDAFISAERAFIEACSAMKGGYESTKGESSPASDAPIVAELGNTQRLHPLAQWTTPRSAS